MRTIRSSRHARNTAERFRTAYNVDVMMIEVIHPYTVSPDWEPPKTYIRSRKAATAAVQLAEGSSLTCIYTDGSGINGKIGAASWSSRTGESSKFVGYSIDYTFYFAEVLAIELALTRLINSETVGSSTPRGFVHIFIDNQAAIFTIRRPGARSGQYHLRHLIQALDKARWKGYKIVINWIPAHQGLEGNEKVDILAKKATGWREVLRHRKTVQVDTNETAEAWVDESRRVLAAGIRTKIKKAALTRWATEWEAAKEGQALRRIQPLPSVGILKIHADIKRSMSSLITQIRTEKIGLGAFLHSCRVPGYDTAECMCGGGKHTAAHVLAKCRDYIEERWSFWEGVKRRKRDPMGHISVEEMLTKFVHSAASFMLKTGLLLQYERLSTYQQDWEQRQ